MAEISLLTDSGTPWKSFFHSQPDAEAWRCARCTDCTLPNVSWPCPLGLLSSHCLRSATWPANVHASVLASRKLTDEIGPPLLGIPALPPTSYPRSTQVANP